MFQAADLSQTADDDFRPSRNAGTFERARRDPNPKCGKAARDDLIRIRPVEAEMRLPRSNVGI